MIRDILRAGILVFAFLVILAEIQEHEEAELAKQQFSNVKAPE